MNLSLDRPLVVLDLETTGTDVANDRVVEVALLRFEPSRPASLWQRRVNPGVPIPEAASAVHGITDVDVRDEPGFPDIADGLLERLAGADLAGYNLRRFDLPLLLAELGRCGRMLDLTECAIVDPFEIFVAREPRSLAGAVQFYLGEELFAAHSAAADVTATARVLDAQLARYADLPQTSAALAALSGAVDLAGRFRREGDVIVFAFGKHRGRPLVDVACTDAGYLRWMLSAEGFLDDVRSLIR